MRTACFLSILLIVFNLPAFPQNEPVIEWKKCFGGMGDDKAKSIIKTNDGGFIICGSSTSNDGDVTGHHGAANRTDAWVLKISATGAVQWQKSYGGTQNDEFETIIALSDGSYMCFGETGSNDGDVTGHHGSSDIWVVKIDQSGNLLWQRSFGGTNEEFAGNMRQNKDGSFYFIGSTHSNDGDITDNPPFGTTKTMNAWIVKMAANGSIIDQYSFGGQSDDDIGRDIIETPDGGYVIAVYLQSFEEVFPWNLPEPYGAVAKMMPPSRNVPAWLKMTLGALPVGITAVDDQYLVTYRAFNCGGNNTTARTIVEKYSLPLNYFEPTIQTVTAFGDCTTPNSYGNYVEGAHSSAVLSPVLGHVAVSTYDTIAGFSTPHGDYDGFIGNYSANGNVFWKKYIGGSGKDYLTSVFALSENEFIVSGHTNSNNGDVYGNHGGYDVWVVKFGTGNQIKGTVFADMNANGIKEANERIVNDMHVESVKENKSIKSLTTAGQFRNDVDTGTYVTRIISPSPYYTSVPASRNSSFATYFNTDSFSFALQPLPGKKDYQVELYAITPARPGFHIAYQIRYINVGTDTLVNGTLTLIKDARLNHFSSTPAATAINGNTLTWPIVSLAPYQSQIITVNFTGAMPPTLNNNDTLLSRVLIDSAGDITAFDNVSELRQRVTGAYDPNDKQEVHGEQLSPQDYSNGKPLLYTVRFQNTGNDTAFTVVIRDTLDAKLNWNALEMVNASHNYTTTIKDGNIITWTFANILLPDKNVNEPASNGYITFRIKPLTTLQTGDTIRNSASIYFDYNLPVKTNTQLTVLKPGAPPAPVFTGLQTNYCGNAGVQKIKIANLPAGGSGITVTVTVDGTTVPVAADSTFSINVNALSAATHTVLVQFSNSAANRTSSSDFTVTAAVNPDVNLSANITEINSLATNVIVTAVNHAGGGTAPLYTFARDKNFTNVSQPESVNNTWTFSPSILAIGDNKIYVRMKTSASCFVVNTAIDSILLKRSSITGITDPDMPGQMINIYPNPFRDVIMINGLSSGKTYTVRLFNLEGKQLLSKRVSGRTSLTITRQHQAKGIYWLSIYDEKRRQMLGTVKMMKE